ncbi:hypothetical protein ACFQ8S_06925 [Streptomyces virginiae]|uniref:hypothetical protein n=1 Tax=Streptomyces virginiae TaxID=1961 RepID=UPI0036D1AA10
MEKWTTVNSHPASGIRYEEWNGQARITRDRMEIVSPSADVDSVYAQYGARVNRWIEEADTIGDYEVRPDGSSRRK